MKDPTFDIFSGRPNENPIWLAAVAGLSNARARMEDIAAQTPGEYFVFSIGSEAVLAQTQTFKKPEASKAKFA
jgi:hypothetical protein